MSLENKITGLKSKSPSSKSIDTNIKKNKNFQVSNPYYIFNESILDDEGLSRSGLCIINLAGDFEEHYDYIFPELEPVEGVDTIEECIANLTKDLKELGVKEIYTGELPEAEDGAFFNIVRFYEGLDNDGRFESYKTPVESIVKAELANYGIKVTYCENLPNTLDKSREHIN